MLPGLKAQDLPGGVGHGAAVDERPRHKPMSAPWRFAWSWDAPLSCTGRRFTETGGVRLIWETDKAGRDITYGQLDKLADLNRLAGDGFCISCLPSKIERGSADFIRAAAILPG